MTSSKDTPLQSLQDLLPKWAHFCLYTEKFITHELNVDLKEKKIVIGVSGGVDSTALLLVLHYLSPRLGCHVIAAHLNHTLRDEADDDARWVQELCASLNIKCLVNSQDIRALAKVMGTGLEEAGRSARYSFFNEVLQSHSAQYIALGHHLDDLSEDVLMRFIRGTGWPGLSGMSGYDPDRNLIRPFLMLPKSTLKAFVTHVGVLWREDATNAESDMTRNRVRNEILPLLLKENPNFRDSVGRLWKIGRIESDYWEKMTQDASDTLSADLLDASHKAARLRLYKACLDRLGPGQALAHTLFNLDEAWQEKRVGAVLQFPGEKTATITASGMVFATTH
ncbi:tRNA lysidine(34) synthetase TilS [Pseudodesulfovibrio sediminis]|uniref:tRNA(Ile)-lysidine synthase n=1 Tax=Pseudodesulfovibrio sediminis TaxID=2810563 RepID=A0ABN6EME6_9BACT|nr:tRNA lysidine(34) synthetase TilS [Pseudodesulfovibrio sediminis]BCS87192.1 tRNA(Ile)-lysidine synthase [Pseudodesulfovibrio sediminis]